MKLLKAERKHMVLPTLTPRGNVTTAKVCFPVCIDGVLGTNHSALSPLSLPYRY